MFGSYCSSCRRMASSHCWSDASCPNIPVRIKRIAGYTRRRVVCVANEAGSSRSCAARDVSDRWMSPGVAVLTGVEFPNAPPAARGGGMKKMSCCCVCIPTTGGRTTFWFWSILWTGNIFSISLWASSGLSTICRLRVICCCWSVLSILGGHAAREACACVTSVWSISVWSCLVLLRVPTPGFAVWGARNWPRPRLIPGFWVGEGVSGSVWGSLSLTCSV